MQTQTHEFQTETKKLLELMIHSLYSHKEIFLRELISNASDALDKLRFEALTQPELLPEDELHIYIEANPQARTLTLMDNGIGMSRQEVIDNLGTIARSGTKAFMEAAKQKPGEASADLIGQFGVGFYSAFLVADRVEVITRRAGEELATRWESTGEGSYTIGDGERSSAGTTLILHLKGVDEEDGLEDYTQDYVLRRLVRRYSDFVAYPIKMQVERQEPVLGADGKPLTDTPPRVVKELTTLNSQEALWNKPESEVSAEELSEFYRHISHDWGEPLTHLRTRIEGTFEANALLFIPKKAPFDLYHRDMVRRGIQLYVKRVFIMDEAKELLPDYLRFMKGVVDAQDLALNVSREILQQNRQIRAIRKHLVKKILDHLKSMRDNNRAQYLEFWRELGPVLKEGLLDDPQQRERLLELVLAPTTQGSDLTTLGEYVERMAEGQQAIYYITGPSLEVARRSPHLEAFAAKGVEVLFFTDSVDEVWLQSGAEYQGKRFQAVGQGEVELGTEEEKKQAAEEREAKEAEYKDLLTALRASVQDDVSEVRLSNRLTSSAACLVTEEGGITPQMQRLLEASGQQVPKVKRILEVNPNHTLLTKLQKLHADNPGSEQLAQYGRLLYQQAWLAEGGQLEDPAAFAQEVAEVMARAI